MKTYEFVFSKEQLFSYLKRTKMPYRAGMINGCIGLSFLKKIPYNFCLENTFQRGYFKLQ